MANVIKLNGCFESTDNTLNNSTFTRVGMRVHALGKNDNKSNITDTAFENAKTSLYGIPIVAKYTEDEDIYGNDGDLTSHNRTLTKDKNGNYILFYDTVPLGFVSPNTNITKEDIEDENGDIKTYICIDEVILWNRYESTGKITEWLEQGIVPKVSMEIGDIDGELEDKYLRIDSYEYQSICALGSDVTPCFSGSEIQSFSKAEFNELYTTMVKEYNKENDILTQNQNPNGIDNIKTFKENIIEGGCNMEGDNTNTTTIVDPVIDPTADFSLSNNQLESEIRKQLSEMTVEYKNYWGETCEHQEYYLMDVKEDVAIVVNSEWTTYYGIPFTRSNDDITLNMEAKVEYLPDYRIKVEGEATNVELYEVITQEFAKIKEYADVKIAEANEKVSALTEDFSAKEIEKEKLNAQITDLTEKFELVTAENVELKEFKAERLANDRTEEETKIFEKYSKLNGNAEYEAVKLKASEFESTKELEKEIALIFVQNTLNFSKNEKNNTTVKVGVGTSTSTKVEPYGELFNKYSQE